MENRKYILKTNFNLGILSDEDSYGADRLFEKKLELLCLEYDVELDYEYE